jgi:hypothetical protein
MEHARTQNTCPHPKRFFSIDSLPPSTEYLLAYDRMHGSEYAEKARELFVRFAEAVIIVDRNVDAVESLISGNFKAAIGYPVDG